MENNNYSEATRQLNMTQPPLTAQINQLEKEIVCDELTAPIYLIRNLDYYMSDEGRKFADFIINHKLV